MKRHDLRTTATALLGAGLLAVASNRPLQQPTQDLQPRVEALEDEMATVRTQLEALAESKADLEAFLAAQARSAKALKDSLATSEKEGFTAGINPKSREVLLAGFRSYVDGLEAAAPDDESEDDATPEPKRGTTTR